MPALCRWLDLLDTQGVDVTDEELLSYISESAVMSKAMDEYDGVSAGCTCWQPTLGASVQRHVQH